MSCDSLALSTALLSLALATATSTTVQTGSNWLAVPVLKFNDDIGLMYGVHTAFKQWGDDDDPDFDWFVEIKLRHSTKNRHEHWLYVDAPHFFGVRLWMLGEFLRIDDANFFGLANVETLDAPDQEIYQYRLTEPRLQTLIFDDIAHRWRWAVGLTFAYTHTTYRPDTVLARDRPLGVDGGHSVIGLAALMYDSRNDDLRPTRGVYLQLYAKAATRPLGSKFNFQGIGTEGQIYFSPLPDLVYAARLIVEDLGGEVPFYEQARIGGGRSNFGLGGVFTQRGFAESRFTGQRKVLSNHEVRYYFPALFDLVSFGLGLFADLSLVTDGTRFGDLFSIIKPSGGFEVSAKWKDLVVVRADLGFSREERVFYIEGRHMF